MDGRDDRATFLGVAVKRPANSSSSSSMMSEEFSAFLPGLLRVPFDALTKKWPQVILTHLDPWTQIHRGGLPKGLKILENTTPWQIPGLDCNPGWLYGFMAFLVLCMAAQLIDLSEPRENEQAPEGRDSRRGNARLKVCEEALATVFIPLEKCHTKDYKPVFKSVLAPPVPSARGNAALRLDFENTWKALVTGRLEIKDDDVLEELFTLNRVRKDGNECDEEGLWVFGCRIAFGFGWAWKMSVVWKILFAYGAVRKERFWWRFGQIGEARGDVPSLSTCLVEDTLDLDFIPIPSITPALVIAFERQLTSGDPRSEYAHDGLNVEFTCLAPHVGFMSTRYLLCCAILLPALAHNVSKSKKTALPFFLSVEDVIRKLMFVSRKSTCASRYTQSRSETYVGEGPENKAIVEAVENISILHAEALGLHESDMVFDRWVRSGFIARHGSDAWRETRLRMKWEAALLRAKVIVRYKVTMVRQGGPQKQ